MGAVSLQQKELRRKRAARLRVLQHISSANPAYISGRTLWRNLDNEDADLQISQLELRQFVQYLTDKNMLELMDNQAEWAARITARGVDFLDGLFTDIGVHSPQEL